MHEIEVKGATSIDVNLGPIRKNKKDVVKFFLQNIEKFSNLEIFLDSADPEVIKYGLEFATKKNCH